VAPCCHGILELHVDLLRNANEYRCEMVCHVGRNSIIQIRVMYVHCPMVKVVYRRLLMSDGQGHVFLLVRIAYMSSGRLDDLYNCVLIFPPFRT